VISLLSPSPDNYSEFEDESVIGIFKTTRGAHRAISALLKYSQLTYVFWDDSIIKKEAGIQNLLLELEAKCYRSVKSKRAEELIVTFRNIEKGQVSSIPKEKAEGLGFDDEELEDENLFYDSTRRLYLKILICHTGTLFNIPDEI
jgi:hypothetical protein